MPAPRIVLLADDDRDDRKLFREALADYPSLKVEDVENGEALLKRLKSTEKLPDLVMLDLNMPVMNGKECLRRMRGDDKLREVPVVIYSTSSRRRDIEETKELGANLFVTKPLSFGAVKRIAGRLMEIDWKTHDPATGYVFSA